MFVVSKKKLGFFQCIYSGLAAANRASSSSSSSSSTLVMFYYITWGTMLLMYLYVQYVQYVRGQHTLNASFAYSQ